MTLEVTKQELMDMVRGNPPYYSQFSHPLVIKAGFSYNDQYGKTSWDRLETLTEQELLQLYKICKESWAK